MWREMVVASVAHCYTPSMTEETPSSPSRTTAISGVCVSPEYRSRPIRNGEFVRTGRMYIGKDQAGRTIVGVIDERPDTADSCT